jgi:GcrA cell cycle regulator
MAEMHNVPRWSAEAEVQLMQWWQAGMSGGEIAKKFKRHYGFYVTRSAVMGKLRRMDAPKKGGIQRNKSVSCGVSILRPKMRHVPANSVSVNAVIGNSHAFPTRDAATAIDTCQVPGGALVDLQDLGSGCCRWPHGEPGTKEFGFCGKRSNEGKPYCEEHMRRAYTNYRNG